MRKTKIKVRKLDPGVWREAIVLSSICGQFYVDYGGTFDWVSEKTHEIVQI